MRGWLLGVPCIVIPRPRSIGTLMALPFLPLLHNALSAKESIAVAAAVWVGFQRAVSGSATVSLVATAALFPALIAKRTHHSSRAVFHLPWAVPVRSAHFLPAGRSGPLMRLAKQKRCLHVGALVLSEHRLPAGMTGSQPDPAFLRSRSAARLHGLNWPSVKWWLAKPACAAAGGSELSELSGIAAGAEGLGGLVAGIPQTAEQQVGLALRCSSFVTGLYSPPRTGGLRLPRFLPGMPLQKAPLRVG